MISLLAQAAAAAPDSGPSLGDIMTWIAAGSLALVFVVDKLLSILKKSGIDPAGMAGEIEKIGKAVEEIQAQSKALHDAHLGDKATDSDGRPKWWNRDETEAAVRRIDETLKIMLPWLKEQRRNIMDQQKLLRSYHNALLQIMAMYGMRPPPRPPKPGRKPGKGDSQIWDVEPPDLTINDDDDD